MIRGGLRFGGQYICGFAFDRIVVVRSSFSNHRQTTGSGLGLVVGGRGFWCTLSSSSCAVWLGVGLAVVCVV